jgi:thiol-disulfide isomerase/thioredoxin
MSLTMGIWKLLWPVRAWWHKGMEVGDYFPDFTLNDDAGRAYVLSDNPGGRLTVLWLTNLCEDCLLKAPLLEELRREAPERFRILAVSLLGADAALPSRVSAQYGFPILLDPEDIVAHKLGLAHPPGTCPLHNLIILDCQRRVMFRHHLSALKPEAFRALWQELLAIPVNPE